MRIISGKYRSRKIHFSKTLNRGRYSLSLRPTSDRAKETLFNVLANRIGFEDITCLDLFAGTGSLGFECLSRGAASCHFVDNSRGSREVIARTAAQLGCSGLVSFFSRDVINFLKEGSNNRYDLIFADPPYDYKNYDEFIGKVMKLDFSIFVLEYKEGANIKYKGSEGLEILDHKVGTTKFKIFITE